MTTKNVVFIDSRVADFEIIIASLSADTIWFLIDATQDGLKQMQCILKSYSELDAIHIISHGSIGAVYLGKTVLNSDNIYSNQAQLETIGSSLTEKGDILLYGCNVAQADVGLRFINELRKVCTTPFPECCKVD